MSTAVIDKAAPRQGRRASAPVKSLEPTGTDESDIVDAEVITAPVPEAAEAEASEETAAPDAPEAAEVTESTALESTKGYPHLAETLEDVVRGQAEAEIARSIGTAAAHDRELSPKAAHLLTSLLVLSATDLTRGNPWEVHKMTQRDWFEGFLFEDVTGWLNGIGDPYTFRAFRTAMSSNDALAAFNSLPSLVRAPGVRAETAAAVSYFAGSLPNTQRVFAAAGL
jgi:hypothetical protein